MARERQYRFPTLGPIAAPLLAIPNEDAGANQGNMNTLYEEPHVNALLANHLDPAKYTVLRNTVLKNATLTDRGGDFLEILDSAIDSNKVIVVPVALSCMEGEQMLAAHWTGVIIVPGEQPKALVIDPQGINPNDAAAELYKNSIKQVFPEAEIFFNTYKQQPVDGFNCGVFTAHNLIRLAPMAHLVRNDAHLTDLVRKECLTYEQANAQRAKDNNFFRKYNVAAKAERARENAQIAQERARREQVRATRANEGDEKHSAEQNLYANAPHATRPARRQNAVPESAPDRRTRVAQPSVEDDARLAMKIATQDRNDFIEHERVKKIYTPEVHPQGRPQAHSAREVAPHATRPARRQNAVPESAPDRRTRVAQPSIDDDARLAMEFATRDYKAHVEHGRLKQIYAPEARPQGRAQGHRAREDARQATPPSRHGGWW
jgi:hypothetical protein